MMDEMFAAVDLAAIAPAREPTLLSIASCGTLLCA
jgi:hypothetical protein